MHNTQESGFVHLNWCTWQKERVRVQTACWARHKTESANHQQGVAGHVHASSKVSNSATQVPGRPSLCNPVQPAATSNSRLRHAGSNNPAEQTPILGQACSHNPTQHSVLYCTATEDSTQFYAHACTAHAACGDTTGISSTGSELLQCQHSLYAVHVFCEHNHARTPTQDTRCATPEGRRRGHRLLLAFQIQTAHHHASGLTTV